MKKLLALVLALVMSMSLVTISNAAYSDAADIDYKEAVDVMSAVGVLQGSDNKFDPKAELTREQAAKIIAYLDLGKDVAEALPAVKVFNDVEASRWSAKFIAYCADAGYINGVGNGNFDPTGKLTGYAFGKLLLCALGYDATIEEMTGASWTIKVAKLMEKNSLTKGTSKLGSAVLTREEAAQYALNALKADMVDYENKGTNITINGAVIATGASKAEAVTGTDAKYGKIINEKTGSVKVYTVQLGEKLYDGKLTKDASGEDDLGHTASVWKYKTTKIGTYADTADYTVVAAKDYTSAVAAYKDLVDDDYKGASVATKYRNGDDTWDGKVKAGDVLEFYLNDNGVVTRAVNTRYSIAKVTKVDTKVSKADKDDDVTAYITLKTVDDKAITGASKIKSTDFVGFNYSKDDVILYVLDGSKVLASQAAKSVEGKVTATKGSKASIDGTYYDTVKLPALKSEGTFYLNAADMIMEFSASVEKSGNYAYIYKVDVKKGLNSEGIDGYTTTVYYVDQAGVKASAVVDATIDSSDPSNLVAYYDSAKTKEVKEGVVSFKINSDKEFELATEKDTIESAVKPSKTVNKDNAVIDTDINATSKTTFIFVEETATKVNVKVVEGYKNVKIETSATVTAITDDDNYALYAFVNAKNGNVASTGYVAVLLDPKPVVTEDDDDTYYEYSVSINGEDTTVTTKTTAVKDALSAAGKGYVFFYNLEDNYVVDLNDASATGITLNRVKAVSATNDDYVVIDNTQYNVGEETVYTITKDYKKDGKTIDTVTVTAGGSYSTDNKVTFTTKDSGKKLDVVFIIEEIK